MSGSSKCPHPAQHFDLNVASFGDTNIRYLEIKGRCTVCEQPMVFRGLPVGMSPDRPAADLDAQEVRLPFVMGDEPYDGKALGFSVASPALPKDPTR